MNDRGQVMGPPPGLFWVMVAALVIGFGLLLLVDVTGGV